MTARLKPAPRAVSEASFLWGNTWGNTFTIQNLEKGAFTLRFPFTISCFDNTVEIISLISSLVKKHFSYHTTYTLFKKKLFIQTQLCLCCDDQLS